LDIFFKFFGNQGELERTKTTKNFFDAGGYLSKVKLDYSLFPFKTALSEQAVS